LSASGVSESDPTLLSPVLVEDLAALQVQQDLFDPNNQTLPKEMVCLFSSCDFCPKAAPEPLHRVVSDAMGITIIEVKRLTQDDRVRIGVADDLEESGDASGSDSLTPETFNQALVYNSFATLAMIINKFQFQFV